MTHEPERVDGVIEEMLCSDCQAIASLPGCDCCGPEVDKDDCEAQTRRYAARVRAALSHERESKRLAVMKVAEEIEKYIEHEGQPIDPESWCLANWLGELAAALRKAVE